MGKPYTAAFLIPLEAHRHLTQGGWAITSNRRLSNTVLEELSSYLQLEAGESWDDVEVRENASIKLSALRDAQGQIEQIFAQLRGITPDALRQAVAASCSGVDDIEVFVPSEARRTD